MNILGIETSCDETACAVVQVKNNKFNVLSSIISSQIEIHKKYGGVVPEVAARQHVIKIIPVLDEAIKKSKIMISDIDSIGVTSGPGLVTSLLVGIHTAKTLAYLWQKALIAVNHMEGHVMANVLTSGLDKIKFPSLCLTVSGGHTELVLIKKIGKYEIVGQTRDDAAGEAFDKVAKIMDLGYPGGPTVSKLAQSSKREIIFPRPMYNSNDLDFSFSGIKTAVKYKAEELKKKKNLSKQMISNICCGFENAVVDVLIHKAIKAAKKYKIKTIMMGGGVSANVKLREELSKAVNNLDKKINCLIPDFIYTTDNAAMIAAAAYFHARKKDFIKLNKISANPVWRIDAPSAEDKNI